MSLQVSQNEMVDVSAWKFPSVTRARAKIRVGDGSPGRRSQARWALGSGRRRKKDFSTGSRRVFGAQKMRLQHSGLFSFLSGSCQQRGGEGTSCREEEIMKSLIICFHQSSVAEMRCYIRPSEFDFNETILHKCYFQ